MYIALTIQHNYDKKRNVVLSNNDECCVDNDATGLVIIFRMSSQCDIPIVLKDNSFLEVQH